MSRTRIIIIPIREIIIRIIPIRFPLNRYCLRRHVNDRE